MGEKKTYLIALINVLIPVGVIGLLLVFGMELLRFFAPFIIAWILAWIANPIVCFFEKRVKLLRSHSTVITAVLVLATLVGGLYGIISLLIHQLTNFFKDLPMLIETITQAVAEFSNETEVFFSFLPLDIHMFWEEVGQNFSTYLNSIVQQLASPTVEFAGGIAKSIPSIMVNVVVSIVAAYFFIIEREFFISKLKEKMPKSIDKYTLYLKNDARKLVGGYFLAQFRIMFVVATILVIGFWILEIPYAFLWGILISLLDFLPVFGTGTILIPWAVIVFFSGEYPFAAGLILIYVLSQVIRQVIQPKIVGDSMGLHPLLTLFLLYIGYEVNGLSGMIFAVPVGMILINLYQYGAFDFWIRNIYVLIDGLNRFRKSND